ncbi:hypothetical protein LZF95_19180 [Algoriphagus sp. AGSA1]|uniref:hypothetical protein n=1 Tax=Algoriphagus sp. AGSA1 TaxID=2907213 RepID=UPI001F219D37|nr:hypothetical protein [Algoriphagus sp. AGSA1]MCE7056812.1 hypothetical protein [Algoriphagus sp. AGSA1]
MQLELTTSYSYNVASLVAGMGVDFLSVLDFGHLCSLTINLSPVEQGIIASDRLYPLKPKNPI